MVLLYKEPLTAQGPKGNNKETIYKTHIYVQRSSFMLLYSALLAVFAAHFPRTAGIPCRSAGGISP